MRTTRILIMGVIALLLVGAQIAVSTSRSVKTDSKGASIPAQSVESPNRQATPQGSAADHGGLVPPFREDDDAGNQPSIQYPEGIPALQPSIKGAGPGMPAFTEADVMQYHKANHLDGVGRYQSLIQPSIIKIEFLTEAQLKARIPSLSLTSPDDRLLCYVQYSGKFFLPGRPGYPPVTPARTSDRATEIFDAHTGNQLLQGVGDWVR